MTKYDPSTKFQQPSSATEVLAREDSADKCADHESESNEWRLTEESMRMNNYRRNRRYIDMVLVCNEKRLSAHRLVLACSSRFLEEVLLKDSHVQPFSTLEVDYVDEETMDQLLTFMYKGSVSNLPAADHMDKLLRTIMVGQYLQIAGAPAYFTEQLLLRDGSQVHNATQLWEWSNKFDVPKVRKVVINHLVSRFSEIIRKNRHYTISFNCFDAVLSCLNLTSDSSATNAKTAFLAICSWVEQDLTNRDNHFEALMKHVNNRMLSWTTMVPLLAKSALLTRSTKIRQLAKRMVGKTGVREAQKDMESTRESNALYKLVTPTFMVDDESAMCPYALQRSVSNMSAHTRQKAHGEKKKSRRHRHRSRSSSPTHREPLPQRSQSATMICETSRNFFSAHEMCSNLEQVLGQRNSPVLFLLSRSKENRLLVHCCRLDNHAWSAAHRLGIAAYKDMAVTYHASTLYLIGGEDATSRTKLSMVYAFDVDTQTLRSGPHLRSPRSCIGVVSHGRLLYLLGGRNRWNKSLDIVEVFHPGEGWFMTLPRMGERRFRGHGALLQKRLYAVGGHTSKCEMLDLRRPSTAWDPIECLPEGFSMHDILAVSQNNMLIVVRYDQPTRICTYNPIRNAWKTRKADGTLPNLLVNLVARRQQQGGGFWALDRLGNVYTYDPKPSRWNLEVCCPEEAKHPLYLAVEDFSEINKSVHSSL